MCSICVSLASSLSNKGWVAEVVSTEITVRPGQALGPMMDGGGLGFLDLDERGGVGTNGLTSFTTEEAAVQLNRTGRSWSGSLGTPVTVTYGFRSTDPGAAYNGGGGAPDGFSRMNATQIAATELLLAAWSDVAGITFQRVGSGTEGEGAYTDAATMLFSNYSEDDSAAAFAYLAGNASTSNLSASGDVWVNLFGASRSAYNGTPTYLAYGYQTLVHEIGHAIGFSHPGDYNAGQGSPTYADATYYEDTRQYSIMSYWSEANTGANFQVAGQPTRYASAPLLDDIAAAQRLYGANMTTRTGDTTYGFNSNAGRVWYDATQGGALQVVIFSVWDAGGNDTLDFSGYSQNGTIDLRQGHFSSVGGLSGNVSIALGAVVEQAIGGSGADTIVGNAANNVLRGNGGADILDGGVGSDTAVYSGLSSAYTITASTEVVDGVTYQVLLVTGADGSDRLYNIEFLQFSNGTIAVPAAAAAGIRLEGDRTDNTLTGTDYADRLFGAGGNDTLNGGGGNDILISGRGSDILNGGAGIDTADYSSFTGALTINLATGQTTKPAGEGGGTDTLSSIENVRGTVFADTITGDGQANRIEGGGGLDTLNGGGGDDTLIAGVGSSVGAPDVVKPAATNNISIGTAVNVDGNFDLVNDPGVANATTVPHAVVRGAGSGTGQEYYAFTVTMGATGVFDIASAGFDTTLRIFDSAGNQLAFNDDDGGSTNSLISYTFTAAGTYYVAVGLYGSGTGEGVVSSPVPFNSPYVLNISIPGHAVVPITSIGSVLNGGDGDDMLHSGESSDEMIGGEGSDTAVFAGNRSAWTITDNGGGQFTISNGSETNTLTDVEFAQFADQIVTLIQSDTGITGTEGDDVLTGTAANETLNGLGGADVIAGLGGADVIDGGDGFDAADYSASNAGVTVRLLQGTGVGGHAQGDTLTSIERVIGSAFDDTLIGAGGAERLEGGLGADRLYGSSGTDTLFGGDGDDLLDGGSGADVLSGGFGFDTADYSASNAGVVVRLFNGTGLGGHAQGDTLTSIERVIGSAYDDSLVGSSAGDTLEGGAGADNLYGSDGNDALIGGLGADLLDGGDGFDTADYSGSNSAVVVRLYNNVNVGGHATGDTLTSIERVVGSAFDDSLLGSNLSDVLEGGLGADRLYGLGGMDTLAGGLGADLLDGGDGFDTADYSASNAAVTVRLWNNVNEGGHAAGDTLTSIERVIGSAFNDVLVGGNAGDILEGGAGADSLFGGEASDVLIGGLGADTLDGGDGFDTVDYSGSDSAVVVRLYNNVNVGGHATGDTLTSIERVVGSAFDDSLLGGNLLDVLEGGLGADRLYGLGSSDTLVGGLGADLLDGGDGFDTADYSASNAAVTVRLLQGTGLGGHAEGDTLTSIERVVGSSYDDILIGSGGADTLEGGNGADRLYGSSGLDTLRGGAGADLLDGGASADVMEGGDGFDTVDYTASNAAVVVRLFNGTGLGGHAQGDTLTSIERLIGSSYDDALIGSSSADTLEGGAGHDRLYGSGGIDALLGGLGDDILDGGAGADVLSGGDGFDTADYTASNAGVVVRLFNGTGVGGHAQGDTLSSIERVVGSNFNDSIVGSNQVDFLEGGSGDDRLFGLDGNDTLIGGAGADILEGGAGADLFVFRSGAGSDVISDFGTASGDVISLDSNIFADFNDVLIHATDTPGGVQISKSGIVVTLTGVTKAQLQASHFEFATGAPQAAPLAETDVKDLLSDDPLILPGPDAQGGAKDTVALDPLILPQGAGGDALDPLILPIASDKTMQDGGAVDPIICPPSDDGLSLELAEAGFDLFDLGRPMRYASDPQPNDWII